MNGIKSNEELRKLALAATPGPWGNQNGDIAPPSDDGNMGYWIAHLEDCGPNWKTNAAFIAAFNPSTALALVDQVERLEKGAKAVCRRRTASARR